MKKSAITGERGDPIAIPSTCSQNSPLYEKYIDINRNSKLLTVVIGNRGITINLLIPLFPVTTVEIFELQWSKRRKGSGSHHHPAQKHRVMLILLSRAISSRTPTFKHLWLVEPVSWRFPDFLRNLMSSDVAIMVHLHILDL